MDFALPEELGEIRSAVRELCARFPGEYWRGLEPEQPTMEVVRWIKSQAIRWAKRRSA